MDTAFKNEIFEYLKDNNIIRNLIIENPYDENWGDVFFFFYTKHYKTYNYVNRISMEWFLNQISESYPCARFTVFTTNNSEIDIKVFINYGNFISDHRFFHHTKNWIRETVLDEIL